MSRLELEFVLDTLNPYYKLHFMNRMEKAINLTKYVKELSENVPKPKLDSLQKNKTYERIMNEAKSKTVK